MTRVVTGICAAQGTVLMLDPGKIPEQYGLKKKSAVGDLFSELTSIPYLGMAIAAYAIVHKGADVNTALGYSHIPGLLVLLKGFLTKSPFKLGVRDGPWNAFLLLEAAAVYGGLTGADWATNVLKVKVAANAAVGLYGLLSPKSSCDTWGLKKANSAELMQAQVASGWFLSNAVAGYFLMDGQDVGTALGYSAACGAAWSAYLQFVSKVWPALGIDPKAAYAWIGLMASYAYTQLG